MNHNIFITFENDLLITSFYDLITFLLIYNLISLFIILYILLDIYLNLISW